MDSLIYSLNATVPVFAVMIAGYLFRKIGLLNDAFVSVANKFVFRVALPCMLFLDLWETDIIENWNGRYIGYCAVVTLISILVIWGLAKLLLKDKTEVGAFVQASYRSSAAILGIAFIENRSRGDRSPNQASASDNGSKKCRLSGTPGIPPSPACHRGGL